MLSDSLLSEIEKYKNNYLDKNGKNMFLKKNQKMNCAKEISQNFSLEDMVKRTIFHLPNTNKILFDYNVFKLYAHTDNYDPIINGILSLYNEILSSYPSFELHVLLNSFTISAAERYKGAIQLFCNKSMSTNTIYSELISKVYIYYTPSMMESIITLLKPFIDKCVSNKIIYYTKNESDELIRKLFESNYITYDS